MCFFFCLSTELFVVVVVIINFEFVACGVCDFFSRIFKQRTWHAFVYVSIQKIKCRKYRNLCVCICVHEYEYLVTIFLFVSLLRSWDRAGRHWIKIKISFQLNICARCFSVLNKKKSLHHSVNSIRSNSNVCAHSPLVLHWFWYNNIICVYNNLVSLWVQHFQRVFFSESLDFELVLWIYYQRQPKTFSKWIITSKVYEFCEKKN